MPDDDLQRQINDLRGNDPNRRGKVLRQLYESPMVASKVKRWIQQYAAGKLDPADVIQESIMILYRDVSNDKFRGEAKLTTYLLRICQLNISNSRRTKEVKRTNSLDTPENNDHLLKGELQTTSIEQEEEDNRLALRNQLLRNVLAQLTQNCQSALALYYTKNKSTKEIADIKEYAGPNQAKNLLHRCRERLRKLIGNDPDLSNFLKTNR
jgi:RNA polymerase sigma factor (sigma-70 family)